MRGEARWASSARSPGVSQRRLAASPELDRRLLVSFTLGFPLLVLNGRVVMLYLGYTQCPDVCPLTLHNIADVLGRLGKTADDVRVLFVTVDPNRDTLPLLKQYTAAFAPEIVGLRGSPDELARLARRYRLAYSVSPATKMHSYEVMHSSAVYVFDRDGYARLLITSLESANSDLSGTADDLGRLLQGQEGGLLARLSHLF